VGPAARATGSRSVSRPSRRRHSGTSCSSSARRSRTSPLATYLGEIESTKSVSELYAPISGKVVVANEQVEEHPEVVNADPYGRGWIAVIESEDVSDFEALLSPVQYEEIIAASAEE